MLTSKQKLLAVLSHLCFLFMGVIITPINILALNKNNEYIAHHAKQALVSQVLTLLTCILLILFFCFSAIFATLAQIAEIFLLLIPIYLSIYLLAIVYFCVAIYVAFKAFNGKYFKYPCIQWLVNKL